MSQKDFFSLIGQENIVQAVRKDRVNETCQMKAWYYQTEDKTYAFAILKGEHGERKDILAPRKYFISSGNGIFNINGVDHNVAKGSIVAMPAHATYNFYSNGDGELEFFVDIGFKLDLDTIPSK